MMEKPEARTTRTKSKAKSRKEKVLGERKNYEEKEKEIKKTELSLDETLDFFLEKPREIQAVTNLKETVIGFRFLFHSEELFIRNAAFYPPRLFLQKLSNYISGYPKSGDIHRLKLALEAAWQNHSIRKVSYEIGWQNGAYFLGIGKFTTNGFESFYSSEDSPWFDFSELEEDPTILFDFLQSFPCPEVSYSLAAFLAVSPLKFSIPHLNYYPAYFLTGEQGSGKTTLIRDFFFPLFGMKPQALPADDTPFASLDAWGLQIPRFFDEFRISEFQIKEFLKLLDLSRYKGGLRRKGTAMLTVQQFPLQATAVIAGETPPLSSRTKERIILSFLPKKQTQGFFQEFRQFLERKPQRFFPAWIRFLIQERAAGLSFPDTLRIPALEAVPGYSRLSVRIQQNLVVLHFGLGLISKFAKEHNIPFKISKNLYGRIFSQLIENITEGISGDLEQFLEDCAQIEEEGRFLPLDYWWDPKRKNVFWLSPTRVYTRWKSWVKQKGLGSERTALSSEAIRHLLRQLDSFIEVGKPYAPGTNKQLRMLGFSRKIF